MPGNLPLATMIPFKRVLVTGADGFVGRHLLPLLVEQAGPATEITLAVRQPHKGLSFRQVPFDLANDGTIDAAIAAIKPDLVIHLAARASIGEAAAAAGETWEANLAGSLALARAVAAHSAGCAVFYTSTAEVYGRSFNDGVMTESARLRPLGPYARSKAATEAMLDDVLPQTSRLIIVRPSNHSGPGQDLRFVIPSFAEQVAGVTPNRKRAIQVGNLDVQRDFLDVRDVTAGYIRVLKLASALPLRATFNISSGRCVSIRHILVSLCRIANVDATFKQDPARTRQAEVPVAAVDSEPFRTTTGWAPIIPLDQTLSDVFSTYRGATPTKHG